MKKMTERKMLKKDSKRLQKKLCVLLTVLMMMTMVPGMAFAEGEAEEQNQTQEQQQTQEKAKTALSGFKVKMTKRARSAMSVTVTVTAPYGRDVLLEQKVKSKWSVKGRFPSAGGASEKSADENNGPDETQNIKVVFPNTWWKKDMTKWRLRIEENDQAEALTTNVMTLKTKRFYQNPKKYVQIKNKISKHGKHYYTYPVKVNNASTRKQHVEAMIKAAKKYLGDPYIVCRSGRPGKGVDCSGLVMQACYAAGVDLWPSNPYRHRFPKYEYESTRIAKMKNLKTVPYSKAKRGDLIFYSKHGTVMHIAIYLGKGKIIHSWPGRVQISRANTGRFGHLSKVKRVFVTK